MDAAPGTVKPESAGSGATLAPLRPAACWQHEGAGRAVRRLHCVSHLEKGEPVHQPPDASARHYRTRRDRRRGRPQRTRAQRPRRIRPAVLAAHRQAGQSLGAYETRYDIRHGYGEERTIIRP